MTKFQLPSLTDDFSDSKEEGDAEPLVTSHQCVGCGNRSPQGHGEHTLISSTYGWRLARKSDGHGGYTYEWRCPTCWKRYKEAGRAG